MIFLAIGVAFMNVFSSASLYLVAGAEAVVGGAIVLLSYIGYNHEIIRLSRDVYPLLLPEAPPAPASEEVKR